MEASTAQPAVADATQTQEAQPAAPGGPPAPETPAQQLDPNSPEAKLAAAEARVRELEAAQQQPQQETDFLSALDFGEEDLALDPAEIAAYSQGEDPQQADAAQQQQQVQEFENYIQDLVEQRVTPLEEARQDDAIRSWHSEHPDLKEGSELWTNFMATMQKIAEEHGEQAAKSLPLIDTVYTAAKAKLADAGAVPAEQAASHGASIETQTGQTQTGGTSEEDDYRSQVFSSSNSKDGAVFR